MRAALVLLALALLLAAAAWWAATQPRGPLATAADLCERTLVRLILEDAARQRMGLDGRPSVPSPK